MLKPPITGMFDRQGPPNKRWSPYLAGYVIKGDWAAIQPNISGKLDVSSIESQLAFLRPGQRAMLRIAPGNRSPEWVKRVSKTIYWEQGTDGSTESSGLIPQFFTMEYLDCCAHLHELLSEIYDNDERIARVDVTGPISFYSPEVCGLGMTRRNRIAAMELGWTSELHQNMFLSHNLMHNAYWKNTPLAAAFAQLPLEDGTKSTAAGLQMLSTFRLILGDRANVLTTFLNPEKAKSSFFLPFLEEQGRSREFSCVQTAAWNRLIESRPSTDEENIAAFKETMVKAWFYGSSVELPKGYERFLRDGETVMSPENRAVFGPWLTDL